MPMNFSVYQTDGFYDELIDPDGSPRRGAAQIVDRVSEMPDGDLAIRQRAAESALFDSGTTFSVYDDGDANERIIPFDVIPRVINGDEWDRVAEGCAQRVRALNAFLNDVYTTGEIIAAGKIPGKYVLLNEEPFLQCRGVSPPGGVYCHISGIDLVRDGSGAFCVLEDNLRCPSGVSYVLENRRVLKQTFPRVFGAENIRPVDNYADKLLETLESLAPGRGGRPSVAVLTPGVYNSAYFEHSFLARLMGVPLVQGDDLVIDDGHVKMRTTRGLQTVDVLYRRIDDAFLDPETFRKDSLLGVPGIMDVYRAGRVALANAPGAGIADNKVIYHYVPEMIDYYLNEKPILNNVKTWLCAEDDQRAYVLEHLAELVVKPAHEAGGKGIVVGPHASKADLDKCAADIAADPDNFIAQPTLSLSRAPTLTGDGIAGRHVDLRPYVLYGTEAPFVLPGGLTRVALKKGSLVVNSSQGGGTKDTWIVD